MDLFELDYFPLTPDSDELIVGTTKLGTWMLFFYTVAFFGNFFGFMLWNGGYNAIRSYYYCKENTESHFKGLSKAFPGWGHPGSPPGESNFFLSPPLTNEKAENKD